MNRNKIMQTTMMFVGLLFVGTAFATSSHDHDMDHSTHAGREIHMAMVDGYHLAYHLIDMKEKMAGAKGMVMEGHDMSQMKSHHLMLYVVGPEKTKIEKGTVGYKVTGPDGADQKAMAMAMKGAFGADVNFKEKGTYTVKTKAILGEIKLIDEFTYVVD